MSEKIRIEDERQPAEKKVDKSEVTDDISLKKQREIAWQKKREEVDSWADSLGAPIDAGIKKAVVALNLAGLPTSASCEGHLTRGISAPWLRISAENEPEQRFVGENIIFQRYADEYNVSLEEMRRMTNVPESAYWQAVKECLKNEETAEYRQWFKETLRIRKIVVKLINEFYQTRKASPNIRLVVNSCSQGGFEVHNGGRDYRPAPENLKPEAMARLEKRIECYQVEMADFGNFIKEKYIAGELPL